LAPRLVIFLSSSAQSPGALQLLKAEDFFHTLTACNDETHYDYRMFRHISFYLAEMGIEYHPGPVNPCLPQAGPPSRGIF
jgi:hypothetical protein